MKNQALFSSEDKGKKLKIQKIKTLYAAIFVWGFKG